MTVGVGLRIARISAWAVLLLGCARAKAPQSQAAEGPGVAARSAGRRTEAAPAPRPQPSSVPCEGAAESWHAGPTTSCNSVCLAESMIVSRCIDSHRTQLVLQAPCECGPGSLSAELAGCRWGQMSVVPREAIPASEHAAIPVDGCKLTLDCAPGKLSVVCDGEEDGTGSSLCDCYVNGNPLRISKPSVWPGEGADTCHAAAAVCLKAAL
jgi:hypothetical protein